MWCGRPELKRRGFVRNRSAPGERLEVEVAFGVSEQWREEIRDEVGLLVSRHASGLSTYHESPATLGNFRA